MNNLFWKDSQKNHLAKDLTETEKELRRQFVEEYLFDYSPVNALIRVGFHVDFAKQFAYEFMNEPFVLQLIRSKEEHRPDDDREIVKKEKQKVRKTLTREMDIGSPASRVAAACQMAKILGMDAPLRIEQQNEHRGGVMAVPIAMTMEQWEANAKSSQAILVQSSGSEE